MLDWNDLRFLLAVKRAGSASAAARALRVDKATVSRRIAALERAVGARLLDRRSSGWTLTPAGRRVVSTADAVALQVATLLADMGGEGTRTSVRLTVRLWFCCEVLLPHLGELRAKAPWLDLNISAGSRVLNLAEREAEVGLRNHKPARGEFVVRKAGDLGSAFYVSRTADATLSPIRTRADLTGRAVVGYPDALSYVPGFAWFDAMAGRLGPVLRVDDAAALREAIGAGLGIGVLPCLLGDRDERMSRILDEHHVETIWLVAPIELARTKAVRGVLDFVAHVFKANARALRGV